MIRLRWILSGFAVGAALAFVAGLLRKRRLVALTGYDPPVAATGPQAVPGPAAVESQSPGSG
ncbi:MAG: hypothetical protein OEW41_03240 [Actinomycetota bacterium]|nr:hypothetical protein [Actinomycetota bacterium]